MPRLAFFGLYAIEQLSLGTSVAIKHGQNERCVTLPRCRCTLGKADLVLGFVLSFKDAFTFIHIHSHTHTHTHSLGTPACVLRGLLPSILLDLACWVPGQTLLRLF